MTTATVTYHLICSATGVTFGAGTAYRSGVCNNSILDMSVIEKIVMSNNIYNNSK